MKDAFIKPQNLDQVHILPAANTNDRVPLADNAPHHLHHHDTPPLAAFTSKLPPDFVPDSSTTCEAVMPASRHPAPSTRLTSPLLATV